jgi:hypothetical protein
VATIETTQETVRIRLTRAERFFGLLRDLELPRAAITEAEAVPAGLAAVRGLRAPGLGLPGVRAVGTWRRRGEKSYVSVRRHQPAVRLRLAGQRFDTVLIGTDDPERVVAGLRPAG